MTGRAAFSGEPYVADLTPGYAVLYKPPLMHSVPLKGSAEAAPIGEYVNRAGRIAGAGPASLLDWCALRYPEVLAVRGRQAWEGGLVHRLDYGAQGLVLAARTQAAMDAFTAQQEAGLFVKGYSALSMGKAAALPGFPPPPYGITFNAAEPLAMESGFRPYGPGRKSVRPVIAGGVLDRGAPYRTAVLDRRRGGGYCFFRLSLIRGFRHQIRCHLAWFGYPIVNDVLYGGVVRNKEGAGHGGESGGLALRGDTLSFEDPLTGKNRTYTIPPMALTF
jgi:23S rRNA pseudouridine1911/1915/1917 synthase